MRSDAALVRHFVSPALQKAPYASDDLLRWTHGVTVKACVRGRLLTSVFDALENSNRQRLWALGKVHEQVS